MKKNLIFSVIFIFLLIFSFPVVVNAGGSEDDKVYKTTLDENYVYGDVKTCTTSSGIAWFEGIETVSGYKFCLWNVKDKVGTNSFACADSSMERFNLNDVNGSDGKTYYGYGCRKAKDESKINYTQKSLYLGQNEVLGYDNYKTCTIIEGDAAHLDSGPIANTCYLITDKVGIVKVKVVEKSTKVATYYQYNIKTAPSKVSELDNKYYYGNVKSCDLREQGHSLGTIVSFDNLKFCGYGFAGSLPTGTVTCEDSSYDKFELTFMSGNTVYKGYGCRKAKDESTITYIKKTIYLGQSAVLADSFTNTCTITKGDAAHLGEGTLANPCHLITDKIGTVQIKVVSKNGDTSYYEYKIEAAPESISELDDNYLYSNVKSCDLSDSDPGSLATAYGKIVKFNGVDFCAWGYAGNLPEGKVECPNGYDKFELTFKADDRVYKGYGCRSLRETNDTPNDINNGDPLYRCDEIVPLEIRNWIQDALNLVKYIALVLVIVLGIVDFIKAAASGEAEQMKKSGQSFLKRIIAVVILFLLPVLVELILNLIEIYGADSTCFPN